MKFSNMMDAYKNPNFKILTRVPEVVVSPYSASERRGCIVDSETTGLDPKTDKITEIGIIQFSFSESLVIEDVVGCYTSLQDPKKPLSNFISKLTGLKDEDLKGKSIDWVKFEFLVRTSEFVICHAADFDRKFLETDVPEFVKTTIKSKPFLCSKTDINWLDRGITSNKLEFINYRLGYFYNSHRAIDDCWAVFNILQKQTMLSTASFPELYSRLLVMDYVILAEGNVTSSKDLLIKRQYKWSDGSGLVNEMCWYKISSDLVFEAQFLRTNIYADQTRKIKYYEIDAKKRFSTTKLVDQKYF